MLAKYAFVLFAITLAVMAYPIGTGIVIFGIGWQAFMSVGK